jgi:Ca2+-transporting ATPase
MLTTIHYKNSMVPRIILLTMFLTALLLFIPPFTHFFEFETLRGAQVVLCLIVGCLSVVWFEVIKYLDRRKVRSEKVIRK